MSEFQICACGSAPGYPHRADCPRPLYNPSDAQFAAWEKDWLNMKTQHTPTPWYLDMDPIDTATDIRAKHGWNGVETIPNQLLAQMCGKRDDTRDANAEFIVRACNAHDELLDACKAALDDIPYVDQGQTMGQREVMLKLQAAIAKATQA